jgi:hypothetical protein
MSHLARQQLAAYWLGDLEDPEQAQLEEHVFECQVCAVESERMAALTRALGELLPSVITGARLGRLRGAVPALKELRVAPGGHGTVEFGPDDNTFVITLAAEVGDLSHVEFSIERPDGTPLVEMQGAPVDPLVGGVHVVCRRHFIEGGFPKQVQMRLRAGRNGQTEELGLYRIDHVISV